MAAYVTYVSSFNKSLVLLAQIARSGTTKQPHPYFAFQKQVRKFASSLSNYLSHACLRGADDMVHAQQEESEAAMGQTLGALLVTPVQRVPRYVLLLKVYTQTCTLSLSRSLSCLPSIRDLDSNPNAANRRREQRRPTTMMITIILITMITMVLMVVVVGSREAHATDARELRRSTASAGDDREARQGDQLPQGHGRGLGQHRGHPQSLPGRGEALVAAHAPWPQALVRERDAAGTLHLARGLLSSKLTGSIDRSIGFASVQECSTDSQCRLGHLFLFNDMIVSADNHPEDASHNLRLRSSSSLFTTELDDLRPPPNSAAATEEVTIKFTWRSLIPQHVMPFFEELVLSATLTNQDEIRVRALDRLIPFMCPHSSLALSLVLVMVLA